MKKYILFTNTKEKYHAHSLEFNELCLLWEHLQEEFCFEKYSFKDILKEYFNFFEYNDVELFFDLTIKTFILEEFGLINSWEFDVDLFEKFYKGELILISTVADGLKKSYILPLRDMNDESDFFVIALNELLSKHGEVTSPIGVVNEYEIVAVDENIEGQEELYLPF